MQMNILTTIFLVTALAIGVIIPSACSAAVEARRANILIFSSHAFNNGPIDLKYKAKLEKAGYTIEHVLYSDANVTWDKISEANLIILSYVPMKSYTDQVKCFRAKTPLFYEYIKAGGGVLMLCEEDYEQVVPVANELLAPLGAEILSEQVVDEENLFQQSAYTQWFFSWTTNVFPHAISEGVKELWYPLGHAKDGNGVKTLAIMTSDPAWSVIVRGETSAYSINPRMKTKSYISAPPIVAVRSYGKGRVVLFPSHSTFWVHAVNHRIWENIVHGRGNGDRFLTNVYDWLGEPSRNNPDVGRPYVPVGDNLIKNPGLEEFSIPGSPSSWEGGLSTIGKVDSILDDKVSHSGRQSLRMKAESASTAEYYTSPVILEEGSMYRLSGWIKSEKLYTEGGGGGYLDGASFALRSGKGTSGWFLQTMDNYRQAIRRTKDWNCVSTTFRWKNKTGKFHVICSYSGCIPATGTVWFDDVELYKLERKQ